MKIGDVFSRYNLYTRHINFPYIIAEAGVNHECNLDLAKRMVNDAAENGAHAIKFQTYRADTIATKHSPAYWDLKLEPTESQYNLFKKYDKFWKNEFEMLKHVCDEIGIEFLSTPFDFESVDFLSDLMDAFKISSSDITNKPFIQHICSKDKPIILSTGASYLHEIEEAVSWVEESGNSLALLHCVLNYPTNDYNASLSTITLLKEKFPDKIVGYSDHTMPKDMKTLEVAVLLGAMIIEKHFTHDKTLPGNDHYHSMDKKDLRMFTDNLNRILTLLGRNGKRDMLNEESARKNARRSIVAAKHIRCGKKIRIEDLTFKRPGTGISPKFLDEVINMKASIDIAEDTIITRDIINKASGE